MVNVLDYVPHPTIELWTWPHILFIVLTILVLGASLTLITLFVKKENTLLWIYRISGIVLFVTIVVNHIDVIRFDVEIEKDVVMVFGKETPYTWWMVALPFTICSFASFVIPFGCFMKKDNFIVHSLYPIAIMGGIVNIFIPNYLGNQGFFEIRTWTGLLHHILSMWIVLLMLLKGFIKPSMKKIYQLPIALLIILALGLIELQAFHYAEAMAIETDLSGFMWYHMDLGLILADFIFTFIMEKFVYKKTLKEIFNFKKETIDGNQSN